MSLESNAVLSTTRSGTIVNARLTGVGIDAVVGLDNDVSVVMDERLAGDRRRVVDLFGKPVGQLNDQSGGVEALHLSLESAPTW